MSFLASNVWASDITIKKGNTASFTYKVVTPPTTTPVSLILVKEFLRISAGDTSQDNVLNLLIKSATDFAEMFNETGDLNTPLVDKEPVVEMDFHLDINRVQAIITNLNYSGLFNKLGIAGNAGRRLLAY